MGRGSPSPSPPSSLPSSPSSTPDAPSPVLIKVLSVNRNSISLALEGETDALTPITGYVISYKSQQESWEEVKVTGKRSHYVLENLRCGTKYQLTATAYNAAGRSPPSAVVAAATSGNGTALLLPSPHTGSLWLPTPRAAAPFLLPSSCPFAELDTRSALR